ncbi:chymotrypsin-2-like [Bactrocera neohumeralis]|uniref:chymotrypsin-2-like n=1 Tax=Bactrocera neohumeralis TaxID=98809 RepID=UPI0021664750|nr:chymotrypsin-2-like [Bactrocera neohumeralis]
MFKLTAFSTLIFIAALGNASFIEKSNFTELTSKEIDIWDLGNHTDELATDSVNRINGGRPVEQIVPYQVSLQVLRRGRYHHFCSGSIISPQHVLTAAHCLTKMNPNEISVVVGTLTWRYGGDRHGVVAMRSHPGFSSSSLIINDIAVLKVTPSFNLARTSISTISLGNRARVGDKVAVRLTGWGSLTPTGSTGLPERLQVLDYHTISNQECAQRGFRITANELCALGERGRGACVGDSGGPLTITNGTPQLVGIVSYGTATCALGRPDVYTRVSSFLPYINRVISSEIP